MSDNRSINKFELRKKWFASLKVVVVICYVIFTFTFAFNAALSVNEVYSGFSEDKNESVEERLASVESSIAFDNVRTFIFADGEAASEWTANTKSIFSGIRFAYGVNIRLLLICGVIALLGMFYLVKSVRPQVLKASTIACFVFLFIGAAISVPLTGGRFFTFLMAAFSGDNTILFYDDSIMAATLPNSFLRTTAIVFFVTYILIALIPVFASLVRSIRRKPHEF
ncbi:MAG: hypothetical protein IKQ71_05525 [Lachnospiraceae bacterium]|nr:hypothetical protein [Lachnospiraceae bacterium]